MVHFIQSEKFLYHYTQDAGPNVTSLSLPHAYPQSKVHSLRSFNVLISSSSSVHFGCTYFRIFFRFPFVSSTLQRPWSGTLYKILGSITRAWGLKMFPRELTHWAGDCNFCEGDLYTIKLCIDAPEFLLSPRRRLIPNFITCTAITQMFARIMLRSDEVLVSKNSVASPHYFTSRSLWFHWPCMVRWKKLAITVRFRAHLETSWK